MHTIYINPFHVVNITPLANGGSLIALTGGAGDSPLRTSVQEAPGVVAQMVADQLRFLMGTN